MSRSQRVCLPSSSKYYRDIVYKAKLQPRQAVLSQQAQEASSGPNTALKMLAFANYLEPLPFFV